MRELLSALILSCALGCLAADTNAKPEARHGKPPELVAGQVLNAVNLTNIVQPQFVAWTPGWDHVVLLGKSGTNHVVVVARRDPESPDRWKLPVVEVRATGGGGWIRGQRYYDHPPKRSEIEGFIRLLLHLEPASFTFREGL